MEIFQLLLSPKRLLACLKSCKLINWLHTKYIEWVGEKTLEIHLQGIYFFLCINCSNASLQLLLSHSCDTNSLGGNMRLYWHAYFNNDSCQAFMDFLHLENYQFQRRLQFFSVVVEVLQCNCYQEAIAAHTWVYLCVLISCT